MTIGEIIIAALLLLHLIFKEDRRHMRNMEKIDE